MIRNDLGRSDCAQGQEDGLYNFPLGVMSLYVSLLRALEESRNHRSLEMTVPSDSLISIVAVCINVAFTLEDVYKSL